jgi:hypothetical protein
MSDRPLVAPTSLCWIILLAIVAVANAPRLDVASGRNGNHCRFREGTHTETTRARSERMAPMKMTAGVKV